MIGTPLTSSITKYGRPVSVAPASKTCAMFGMVHQRQRLPLGLEAGDDLRVSMPSLMTLSATRRRTGSSLLGQVHDAHAAFAEDADRAISAEGFRQMTAGRPARGVCLGRGLRYMGGNEVKLQHAPRTRLTGLDFGSALRATGVHDAPSEALQKRLHVSVTARDKTARLLQ